jgi:hypothetical protein
MKLKDMKIGVPFLCETEHGEYEAIRLDEKLWDWVDQCTRGDAGFDQDLREGVTIIDWFDDSVQPATIQQCTCTRLLWGHESECQYAFNRGQLK